MLRSPLEDGGKSFTEPVADLVHICPITNRVGDVGFGHYVFEIGGLCEGNGNIELFLRR